MQKPASSKPLHPLLLQQLSGATDTTPGTPLHAALQEVSRTYERVDKYLDAELGMASKLLPLLRLDVAGKVVEWNSQLAQMTGVPPAEAVGVPFIQLVLPEARGRVVRMQANALQGHISQAVHVPLLLKNGWQATLSLGSSPHYDVQGRIVGVISLAQVLSPLAPADEPAAPIEPQPASSPESSDASSFSNTRLSKCERLLQSVHAPIISVDARGRVDHWNARLEAMTGPPRPLPPPHPLPPPRRRRRAATAPPPTMSSPPQPPAPPTPPHPSNPNPPAGPP